MARAWLLIVVILALVFPRSVTAQAPTLVDGDALTAQLTAALQDNAADGVVVLLLAGEEVVYLEGIGQNADGAPIDPSAAYALGSAAEPLITTSYLAVEERDLLPMDTPVVNRLPNLTLPLARSAENIQVRRLLDHTAGLGSDPAAPVRALGPAELANIPQVSFPGARFSYCTRCTGLLLTLSAAEIGLTPALLLEDKLFFPLRMNATRFAHGQITAPPEEVARFMSVHLQMGRWRGVQIITPESIARMTIPRLETGRGLNEHIGYGWWLTPSAGLTVEEPAQDRILRAYDMTQHTAQMALAPGYGRGILIMTDQANAGLDDLMAIAMRAFFGWDESAFEPPNPAGFTGMYRAEEPVLASEIDIQADDDGALTVTVDGTSAPARFIGPRTLAFDWADARARLHYTTNWRAGQVILSINGATDILNRRG